jgi:ornithine decarboxylase
MGTGFDVASAQELQDVINLGAKPNDLIFANPMKTDDQIIVAKKNGVKKMTFDSIEELGKIARCFPKAECILRIATDTTTAMYNLSEKYGAPMEDVDKILIASKKLGLYVKGGSFHTGSGGVTFDSYKTSVLNARKIFDKADKMGLN